MGHISSNWKWMGPNDNRAMFQYKNNLSKYSISIIKVRQSSDCPIFMMRILKLIRQHLYIETGPWTNISCIFCDTSFVVTENLPIDNLARTQDFHVRWLTFTRNDLMKDNWVFWSLGISMINPTLYLIDFLNVWIKNEWIRVTSGLDSPALTFPVFFFVNLDILLSNISFIKYYIVLTLSHMNYMMMKITGVQSSDELQRFDRVPG